MSSYTCVDEFDCHGAAVTVFFNAIDNRWGWAQTDGPLETLYVGFEMREAAESDAYKQRREYLEESSVADDV